MPTIRDFIASLAPAEQATFLADLRRRWDAARRRREVGALQANVEEFGAGAGMGAANTLGGLATLPLAATNALGLTDTPVRPLMGEGGVFANEPSRFSIGPAAGLGQFVGFLGSLAGTGGFGAARGLSRAVGLGGTSLLSRAGAGATELGALTFATTPGSLADRAGAAAHAAPAGAVLGLAGRALGVRTADGKLLVGRAADRFLAARGGLQPALDSGAVTGFEPLGRYVVTQATRQGAAGLATPGFSPLELTGQPHLDSALFNAGFGAMAAAVARAPRVPERARALDAKTALATEAPGDIEPPLREPGQLPLFPERAEAPYPQGPGRLPGQRALDFGAPPAPRGPGRSPYSGRFGRPKQTALPFERPLRRDEPSTTGPRSDLPPSPERNPEMYEEGPLGPQLREEFIERQAVATTLAPDGRPFDTEGWTPLRSVLTAPGVNPDIVPTATPVPPVKLLAATRTHVGVRSVVEGAVHRALDTLPRAFLPPDLRVRVSRNYDANKRAVARWSTKERTLTLFPDWFTLPEQSRAGVVAHELAHFGTLRPGFTQLNPFVLGRLFERAGYPPRDANPPKLNGRDYGYTSASEFLAELSVEALSLSPLEFRRRWPGGRELLDAAYGSAGKSFFAGIKQLRRRSQPDALFPPEEGRGFAGEIEFVDAAGRDAGLAFPASDLSPKRDFLIALYSDQPSFIKLVRAAVSRRFTNTQSEALGGERRRDELNSLEDSIATDVLTRFDAREFKGTEPPEALMRAFQDDLRAAVEDRHARSGAEGITSTVAIEGVAEDGTFVDLAAAAGVVTDLDGTRGTHTGGGAVEPSAVIPPVLTASKGRAVGGAPSGKSSKPIFERDPVTRASLEAKLDRVLAAGDATLASIPDARTREIIKLRFGALRNEDGELLYRNPDGSPVVDRIWRASEIAAKLNVSTTRVNQVIAKFALHETVNVAPLEGYLLPPFGNLRGRRIPLGEDAQLALTRKAEVFRPRAPGGGRLELPRVRETIEGGAVTKRERFLLAGPRVVPADVTYVDPVTGATLSRQGGLFEARDMVQKRTAHERTQGVERAADQPQGVPEMDPAERAASTAANEAANEVTPPPDAAYPQGEGALPGQLPLRAKGFGGKKQKFTSSGGLQASRDSYDAAQSLVGFSGMTDELFAALPIADQLRHSILRLSRAYGSPVRYARTLRKYARLLGDNVPLLSRIDKLPPTARLALLLKEAERLHVKVEQVARPQSGRPRFRLTELDTGVIHDVRDPGAVAILLDGRDRRLRNAPSLLPPEFDLFRLRLPADETGPRPQPEDYVGQRAGGAGSSPPSDAEAGGRPPEPPAPAGTIHDTNFAWKHVLSSKIRFFFDHAGTVASTLKDPRLVRMSFSLRDAASKATIRIAHEVDALDKLAKQHGLKLRNPDTSLRLGHAADATSTAVFDLMQQGGDAVAAEQWFLANRDRIWTDLGLAPNEIAFLKNAGLAHDRLFRKLGMAPATFLPGYFPRYSPSKAIDRSTVTDFQLQSTRSFWALIERTGELSGRSVDFRDVWGAYYNAAWRWKLFTAPDPVLGGKSPLEYGHALVTEFSPGGAGPEWLRPFKIALERAVGIPDEGIARSRATARENTQRARSLVDSTERFADAYLGPIKQPFVGALRSWSKSLGLRIEDPHINTAFDVFVRLHRGRTFGLHAMRSIRHVTQSSFTVLPRVGPEAFGYAFKTLLDPARFEQAFLRGAAAGIIRPAFVETYFESRNRFLSAVDRMSFMYSRLDTWERLLGFVAQEHNAQKALVRFKANTSLSFDERFASYAVDSGLNMLHPAWHVVVRDQLFRGNYAEAARRHAKLLVDHSIFDYSLLNAPLWRGSMWGRVGGQYGSWPLAMVENMHALLRFGSGADRARALALYAGASAAVYGVGQFFGVKTADWIPFAHSIAYSGGPGFSLGDDFLDLLRGDPQAQDAFLAAMGSDPGAAMAGLAFRYSMPAGDVAEGLLAELNMSRRMRRHFGLKPPAKTGYEFATRMAGFRPISETHSHTALVKKLLTAPIEATGVGEAIAAGAGRVP